eukprot:scaffold16082_cov110-Isochrysis_galbana.AAC.2
MDLEMRPSCRGVRGSDARMSWARVVHRTRTAHRRWRDVSHVSAKVGAARPHRSNLSSSGGGDVALPLPFGRRLRRRRPRHETRLADLNQNVRVDGGASSRERADRTEEWGRGRVTTAGNRYKHRQS